MKIKFDNIGQLFFYSAYALYICFSMLTSSMLEYDKIFSSINTFIRYGIVTILLILSIMYRRLKINNTFILFVVVSLIFIFNIIFSGKKNLIMFALIIFAAKDTDFEKLIKLTFKLVLCVSGILFILSVLGIISNRVYLQQDGQRLRYSLGFVYANMPSKFVLSLTMMYTYIRKEKIALSECAIIGLINWFIYYITDTRASFYISVLILAITYMLKYLKNIGVFTKILAFFSMWGFEIAFSLSFVISLIYIDSPLLQMVNKVLNSRLWLGYSAIKKYGVSLFGRKIDPFVGPLEIADNPTLIYNYVDSAYIQLILTEGVVFMIILGIVFFIIGKLIIKEKKYYLALMYVIMYFYSMVEPGLLNFAYYPFLLYISTLFVKKKVVEKDSLVQYGSEIL